MEVLLYRLLIKGFVCLQWFTSGPKCEDIAVMWCLETCLGLETVSRPDFEVLVLVSVLKKKVLVLVSVLRKMVLVLVSVLRQKVLMS